MRVDVFVLHGAPQSLGEDVVHAASAAVHADENIFFEQRICVLRTREMRALIGVVNPRCRDRKSAGDVVEAETNLQRWREFPGDHVPRIPIEDCDEVTESARDPDVRDVSAPDFVGMRDPVVAQKIRVHFVSDERNARFWLCIYRFKA